MIQASDKRVVQELAKQYMEYASSPKQSSAFERMKKTNDLIQQRPPVLLDEIPWYQMDMDGELKCVSQDERVRGEALTLEALCRVADALSARR